MYFTLSIFCFQLSSLSNIDLANITRLQPESVINMSKFCKNLHCVNMSLNSVINDECVEQLAVNLPKLTRLYCVSCNISDRGLCTLDVFSSKYKVHRFEILCFSCTSRLVEIIFLYVLFVYLDSFASRKVCVSFSRNLQKCKHFHVV